MHNESDTCRKSTQLCLKCLSVSYIMPDKQVSSDVYKTLYNISPMCGMGEGGGSYTMYFHFWEVIIIKVIFPYTYVCSL